MARLSNKKVYGTLLVAIFLLTAAMISGLFTYTQKRQNQDVPISHPHSVKRDYVEIAMIEFNSVVAFNNQIEATIEAIRSELAPLPVHFNIYDSKTLETKVKAGEVDYFIASSGFYWRMMAHGARSIATQSTPYLSDPNHSAAIAFVVKDEASYKSLSELVGKRLVASYPTAFYGFRIGLAELAFRGYDPAHFFHHIEFLGTPQIDGLVQALLRGTADMAFFPACAVEELPRELRSRLRVIEQTPHPKIHCQVSTRTYPGHTLATLNTVDPEIARKVAKAVFNMKVRSTTEWWSIATDFTAVDTLYKTLKIGPYSYLNDMSLRDWVIHYQEWIFMAIIFFASLLAHSLRAKQLVDERTEELQQSVEKEKAAEQKYAKANLMMEKLQKANTVGMISSMITHELAQPLETMSHYLNAQKILLAQSQLNRDKLQVCQERLQQQALRAREIVTKVRHFAKTKKRVSEQVDLVGLLHRVCQNLFEQETTIPLHVQHCDEAKLLGDGLELELALWNLLKNAREAATKSLELGQESWVSVLLSKNEESIVVEITNTGPRISEEEIQEMLTPLNSQKESGLGLGLAIVQSIVELHGGHLSFSPRLGGGLQVCLTLDQAK